MDADAICDSFREELSDALLNVDVFRVHSRGTILPLVSLSRLVSTMFLSEWVQRLSLLLLQSPNITLFPLLTPPVGEAVPVMGVLFQLSSWLDVSNASVENNQSGEGPLKRRRVTHESTRGNICQMVIYLSTFICESEAESYSWEVKCALWFCEAVSPQVESSISSVSSRSATSEALSFRVPKVKYTRSMDMSVMCMTTGDGINTVMTESADMVKSWLQQATQFTLDCAVQNAVDAVTRIDHNPYFSHTASDYVYRCYNVTCANGSLQSFACRYSSSEVTLLMLPSGGGVPCSEADFLQGTTPIGAALCLPMTRGGGAKIDICVSPARHVFVRAYKRNASQPAVCAALTVLLQVMDNWKSVLEECISKEESLVISPDMVVQVGSGAVCTYRTCLLYQELLLSVSDTRLVDVSAPAEGFADFKPLSLCKLVLVPSCLQVESLPAPYDPSSEQLLSSPLRLASIEWTWPNHAVLHDTMLNFIETVYRNSLDEVLSVLLMTRKPLRLSDVIVSAICSRAVPFVTFACLLANCLHSNSSNGGSSQELYCSASCSSAYLWDTGRATFDLVVVQRAASSADSTGVACNTEKAARLVVEKQPHATEEEDKKTRNSILTVESDGRWGGGRIALKCTVDMGSYESTSTFRSDLTRWIESLGKQNEP